MRFGVHISAHADGMDLRAFGRLLEERGGDALYLPEHTHVPVTMASEHPGGPEAMGPSSRLLDPFVALGFVAAATDRLRLGTGVCLVPQRDPIVLAKEIATLDVLSGGRALLGIGAGWNREEMANHGVDPKTRFAQMREQVLAIKRLWTDDEAEFHGDFVDFGPVRQQPKPRQTPHPPILVGGEGPGVLARVAEYGDTWLPNAHPGLVERTRELQSLADERGRSPIPTIVFGAPWDRDAIARYQDAGIAGCVFDIPYETPGTATAGLDRFAELIAEFR